MRITFVLPTVNMSGGIKVAAIYAKILAERGHEVTLVSPPQKDIPFWKRIKKFLMGGGWPNKVISNPSHLDHDNLNHYELDRWRPVADQDVPIADVVIATWWETAEWVNKLSAEKGAKVYFIQHHEIWHPLPALRCHATYKFLFHKIVIARWLKDVMKDQYSDDVVDLVPNSVDKTQFFAPLRGKQSKPTIGFMYSTSPVKAIGVAFKAIDILQKRIPSLRIISFGSQHPNVALPLPSGAEYYFSPPQEKIRDLYAQCDVWIAASRSEGFYLPAIEAMACRTPVVSTRTGWPSEAISQKVNGVLVDIDDYSALATSVEWVLSLSDSDWKRLSLKAYETAAKGSWEKSAELFESALAHACQRASRGEILGGSSNLGTKN